MKSGVRGPTYFLPLLTSVSKKRKNKNRRAPWISAEIIKLVGKKKRLYKKAKNSKSDESWSTYKKASNLNVEERMQQGPLGVPRSTDKQCARQWRSQALLELPAVQP